VADVADGWKSGFEGLYFSGEGLYDGAVLDVGGEADGDGVGVAADDGAVPDGGFVPVGDVSDNGCGGGYEGVVCFEGFGAPECHYGAVAGEDLSGCTYVHVCNVI